MNDIDKSKLKKELYNHTEDLVLDTMKNLLEKESNEKFEDVCTCKYCLLDIASYSLNRLPAKYVASPRGSLHTKLEEFEQQYQVDIIKTLTRAINLVNQKPSPKCQSNSK